MKKGQDLEESWKKNWGEIRNEIEVEDSDKNLGGLVVGSWQTLSFPFLFHLLYFPFSFIFYPYKDENLGGLVVGSWQTLSFIPRRNSNKTRQCFHWVASPCFSCIWLENFPYKCKRKVKHVWNYNLNFHLQNLIISHIQSYLFYIKDY